MTPHNEERPAVTTGRPSVIESRQDRTQATTATQLETVLALLMDQPAVCSSEFYSRYLPRFGARLWELRHRHGYEIWRRPCDNPDHLHRNRAFLYELVGLPYDPTGKGDGDE